MQRLLKLFAICALWSLPAVSAALDCSNKTAVEAETKNCLTKSGITAAGDATDLQEELKKHLNVTCRDEEKYKSALSCVITMSKDCAEKTGGDPTAISDIDKSTEGLAYLCDHHEEVDGACFNRVSPALLQCVNGKLAAEFTSSSDFQTTAAKCKAFEFAFDCMDDHLSTCGEKTKDVFYNYAKYVVPPACGGAPFIQAASFWVLSLAALMAALIGSSLDF